MEFTAREKETQLRGNAHESDFAVHDLAAALNSIKSSNFSIGTQSSSTENSDEEDSELPPPKPIVAREPKCNLMKFNPLLRGRSFSPKKTDAPGQPQERRGMTRVRSMPCLQYDRSAYNRSMGQAVLASVSEHDGSKGRGEAKRRVEEFDQLLQDIE